MHRKKASFFPHLHVLYVYTKNITPYLSLYTSLYIQNDMQQVRREEISLNQDDKCYKAQLSDGYPKWLWTWWQFFLAIHYV